MNEKYANKIRNSDKALLDRTVFLTGGYYSCGEIKLLDLIDYYGPQRFKSFFVDGEQYWLGSGVTNEIDGVSYLPNSIYDVKNGKRLNAMGALVVYVRYRKFKAPVSSYYPGAKRSCGGYMRHPKTLNILKAFAISFNEEGEPAYRGKQTSFRVTAWDDIWRRNEKCWKSHRKSQYK